MRADVDAPRSKLVPTSVHNGDIFKPVQQTVQAHSATVSGEGDRGTATKAIRVGIIERVCETKEESESSSALFFFFKQLLLAGF